MALTHLDSSGQARMVDVGAKPDTHRTAVARATVTMSRAAYDAIVQGNVKKGDALGAARIAGVMAAKRTSDLIPLCHPITLTRVEVRCEPVDGRIEIEARVECVGKTGVEMEALTAVSIAALTIYDMVKGMDRGMKIGEVRLVARSGGKSGEWTADDYRHDREG
ncbi:MAG: cyclic pyranopterin monophosphate synthase MoaC [Anaerolineae bacterium]|nr:cyclic pyranopterin monophosphate synthase MoaC [Candidatus Roseilinea sp.]MDW8451120.1 cyclic pyranopterin monophosphate synthase MoaC [Anaerolineae bacterium]